MPSITPSSSGRRSRRTINEINMVPFIDVMLVLLIIFMVTAPMISPSMITLPSVAQADKRPDKIIQVVIKSDGQLEVKSDGNSSKVSLSDLASTVKNFEPTDSSQQSPVVISADKHVEYDKVISAMNELQKIGIKRLGLSVELAR